jgi:SPOR domain
MNWLKSWSKASRIVVKNQRINFLTAWLLFFRQNRAGDMQTIFSIESHDNYSREYPFILSGNCYFCSMIRFLSLIVIILGFSAGSISGQAYVKTTDLFKRGNDNYHGGELRIVQDPSLDTLINRYILISENIYRDNGHYGMKGFRIQIYNSSNRNAREESNKVRAEFISKFPDLVSYPLYAEPGYFKIRVGDFRTRTEATRLFQKISKEFPEAYLVPDIINFPDQNIK